MSADDTGRPGHTPPPTAQPPIRTLGRYQIVSLVGRGGMGEVYRGRDTRLDRDVAIKILPPGFRDDSERVARFDREARLLASLSHPHIATLFGIEDADGVTALVMEFVDGDDLSMRVGPGVMRPAQALDIARQIAAAVEAAHAHGIVHRDLKPANIKLRRDGTVKVLDFGLAKALTPDAHAGTTLTIGTTAAGVVLGTPAYMSPEQARGDEADRQSDIWSFGVLLYELLTGISPFARPSTADTLASVVGGEADYSKLPADTPSGIQRLLRRCLDKDRSRRWHHMGDIRIAIEDTLAALTSGAGDTSPTVATPPSRRLRLVAAAVVTLAAVTALGLVAFRWPSPAAAPPMRFSIAPPVGNIFLTPLGSGSSAPVGGAISPDGRTLAYTAMDATGTVRLWVRAFASLEARALPGTEGAALPFWSPDSKSVGFFGFRTLKRVDLANGAVQTLCDVSRGRGGSWNRDGTIVFAPALASALSRVSATGGTPQPLTTLAAGQRSHRFPFLLPGGRRFLYYVEDEAAEKTGVFVGDLDRQPGQRLLAADSAALYASGRLLFVRQGTLFAQPFDPSALTTSGEPVSVATTVPSEGTAPAFSVSDAGVLTYRNGPDDPQQFAWFDRSGRFLETVGPPGNYRGMELSRDGQRVAVHRHDGTGGDIWVFEPRGAVTRVTFEPSHDNASPVWSPDGTRIAFGSLRGGKWGLYVKRADSTPADELILENESPKVPSSWSPDGKYLVHWLFSKGIHVWMVEVDTRGAPSRPVIGAPYSDTHAQVSPDGKWLAYLSAETGVQQLYVRSFPSGDGKWQVAPGAAVTPRWGRDGKELFYISSFDQGTLMSIPIRSDGATFEADTPRALFPVGMVTPPHSSVINTYHTYAVSPDSQRFLIPRPVATLRGEASPSTITVVLNWDSSRAP